ncbi:MAG: hypothetical protein ABWY11_13040 [Umezawaea sp.]
MPMPAGPRSRHHSPTALAIPSTLSFHQAGPDVAVPMSLATRLAPQGVHRVVFFGDLTRSLRERGVDWPLVGVRDWHRSIAALARLSEICPVVPVSRYEHGLLLDPAAAVIRALNGDGHTISESLRKTLRRTLLKYWAATSGLDPVGRRVPRLGRRARTA